MNLVRFLHKNNLNLNFNTKKIMYELKNDKKKLF